MSGGEWATLLSFVGAGLAQPALTQNQGRGFWSCQFLRSEERHRETSCGNGLTWKPVYHHPGGLVGAGITRLSCGAFLEDKMRGMYQAVTPPPPCFSQVTGIKDLKCFGFYQF